MTAGSHGAARSSAPGLPSQRFGAFALVMAIAGPLVYTVLELRNWPLFTYHPATGRLDWLFAPAVRDMGPAMHWYGWTAGTLIGAAALGWLVSRLPARLVEKIPGSLGWVTTLLVLPPLVYGLRYYWRW